MPQKDQAYHEAAIKYNEGLAEAAENLAPTLPHEEVQRWCVAVGKQHRFHAKRHQSALNKILARQANVENVEPITDGLDVPAPADEPTEEAVVTAHEDEVVDMLESKVEDVVTSLPDVNTFDDGCVGTHKPLEPTCEYHPKPENHNG